MKILPSLGLLSSPYFARDASCVTRNIDWTPCCCEHLHTTADCSKRNFIGVLAPFLNRDMQVDSCIVHDVAYVLSFERCMLRLRSILAISALMSIVSCASLAGFPYMHQCFSQN